MKTYRKVGPWTGTEIKHLEEMYGKDWNKGVPDSVILERTDAMRAKFPRTPITTDFRRYIRRPIQN